MPKIITDEKLIDHVLTRGVEMVYPTKEELKKLMMTGKQIKIYVGFDPTASSLHIGNATGIRKLAQLQALGHKVIFLIGDFTAMIGDPDKLSVRKPLTKEQVLENCKDYKKQAQHLIDFEGPNAVEIKYNSEWLSKLTFEDVINLASNMTVQQMLERDMFQKRIEENRPIYIHEFMYPLMQGYDCVAMDVDLELGGADQTFNMLTGRTLMKALKDKEKFVLTLRMLADPQGKKMGKTTGNMISLTESADEMFGQVMSWTDGMIIPGFDILTDLDEKEIKQLQKQLDHGANPRDIKMKLAQEVVKIYKGDENEAEKAKENFINLFSKGQGPEEVEEVKVKNSKLMDILVETKLCSSNSESKRVIKEKGVKVDEKVIDDINAELDKGEHLIQKGKRHFVKVIL